MHIYKKLIRDRIPEIMDSKDVTYKVRKITSDTEYKRVLITKLKEEAQEVADAGDSISELSTEIADVLEVIDSIVACYGLDIVTIKNIQQERRNTRGGFEQRLFLEFTE